MGEKEKVREGESKRREEVRKRESESTEKLFFIVIHFNKCVVHLTPHIKVFN